MPLFEEEKILDLLDHMSMNVTYQSNDVTLFQKVIDIDWSEWVDVVHTSHKKDKLRYDILLTYEVWVVSPARLETKYSTSLKSKFVAYMMLYLRWNVHRSTGFFLYRGLPLRNEYRNCMIYATVSSLRSRMRDAHLQTGRETRHLDDITSPLQILDLDNLFEKYGSMLRCRSLWDTLYVT